ncbi:hypothetical protein H0H87_010110 [Tephrocybe sp. NHM501043]|nr:hypothetical protein H0H87_010110 [Tephrocybe sp. NHM501043]
MAPRAQVAAPPLLPQHQTPPTPASHSPPTQDPAADQAFADFMSSLTPTSPSVLEEFPTSFDQFGSLDSIIGTTNSEIIPTPSTHPLPSSRSRLHPRRTMQPYSAANRRRKLKEKPLYTRRQVDDMLNAVSNCFAGTMEEVLKRVNISDSQKYGDKTPSPAKGHEVTDDPNQELRKVLSDTLPRLFNGLQNFLDERIKTD